MNNRVLKLKANDIRKDIIEMTHLAGTGHPGGSLGMADIFTYIYFNLIKNDPKKPKDKSRDFIILSNGHICPVLYATLAHKGYFKITELKTLRQINSRLQGHPHNGSLPGIENSGGPLGQGISQAVGLAASLKRDKKKNHVYCLMGDGELNEGQCWEAFLFANKENLDNLTVIIDRNNIQIDGKSDDVMNLNPLDKKLSAFGFKTIELDGNNFDQIKHAFAQRKKIKHPVALIAKTIPGKNVSYMQNKFEWHGVTPNEEQRDQAIKELNRLEKKILDGEL